MTLGLMNELLDILNEEEDDGKVAVRLTRDQIDDILNLIVGETARGRVIEDSIQDSSVKQSMNAYIKRLLDTMNDIHSQLPNE
jgi:hypothetical protein